MHRTASLLVLCSLVGCASWSAPPVIPIRGAIPRQILIMPLVNRSTDLEFESELNEEVGIHVEGRGYQSIRPSIARTLLGSYGWTPKQVVDPSGLPFDALKEDHEVDAVLITELVDWQADRSAGKYRYRMFWALLDCGSGGEIWRYDDGGQVASLPRQRTGRIIYPEDLALGPGPSLEAQPWKPVTSRELARILQRNMAQRLPLVTEGGQRGWRERN